MFPLEKVECTYIPIMIYPSREKSFPIGQSGANLNPSLTTATSLQPFPLKLKLKANFEYVSICIYMYAVGLANRISCA